MKLLGAVGLKTALAVAGLAVLVLAAPAVWNALHPVQTTNPGTPRLPLSSLMNDLAQQVGGDLGTSESYQVISVKQGAWPVGTLVLQSRPSEPVSYEACAPKSAVLALDAPNLFPSSYRLRKAAALDVGLSPNLSFNPKAKVDLSDKAAINLGFEKLQIAVLADDQLDALIDSDSCRQAVSRQASRKRALLIVRGYVLGKRQFSLDRAAISQGSLSTKVGNFDIDAGSGQSTVEVTDQEPHQFLEIVSAVAAPKSAKGKVELTTPTTGLVYIQQDRADTSAKPEAVQENLRTAKFSVVSFIQPIPSGRMPTVPSVRYFNYSDVDTATSALEIVKKTYPTAVLVRLPLSSPPGQLEVWLPQSR